MKKREKIIAKLKDAKNSLKIPYQEEDYYTIREAKVSILEEVLVEVYDMTYKEVSELQNIKTELL